MLVFPCFAPGGICLSATCVAGVAPNLVSLALAVWLPTQWCHDAAVSKHDKNKQKQCFSQCVVSVAASALSPSTMGGNRKERVVMANVYRHDRVMQAGRNVVQCYHSACFLVEVEECLSGHLCCRCGTQNTRTNTGNAFLCAAAAQK